MSKELWRFRYDERGLWFRGPPLQKNWYQPVGLKPIFWFPAIVVKAIHGPRWLHRISAWWGGYFWISCWECGKGWGGHQWDDRRQTHYFDTKRGKAAYCPSCAIKRSPVVLRTAVVKNDE